MTRIISVDDPRLALVRTLSTRRGRDLAGLFFTEGLRFVAQALERGAVLQSIIAAPKMLTHPLGQKLLAQAARRGVPVLDVTPEVFLRCSRAEEAQWIGAVAAQNWDALAGISAADGLGWVALDTIHSPGNLGTILRTCEAVGAAGLICLGPDVDPYDPACVRATMGALFAQKLVRTSAREFADWRRRTGCALVGTSPHAGMDFRAAHYPRPLVLWMGGERKGLSPGQQAACDLVVRIPMVGRGDSLNVAVASGVMLYEVFGQHRAPSG